MLMINVRSKIFDKYIIKDLVIPCESKQLKYIDMVKIYQASNHLIQSIYK